MVICYVDFNKQKSGAKTAVKYPLKKDKRVINLFKEEDRPFYCMSKLEIDAKLEKIKNNLEKKRNNK